MRCSSGRLHAAAMVGLALSFSLSAHAQMYPKDIHSQHRPIETGRTQPSFGIMATDSASEFLQRRNEEERERRESQERQRRMMENYTNIPDQLRESYPRRLDTPYGSR